MRSIALLGMGRWGKNHLRLLLAEPVNLYLAELSPTLREEARVLGVPENRTFSDYRELIDLVDAAVVVTPAETHHAICRDFLSQGKDVLVEKPITLHSAEARELAELAESKQRLLQVGHIFRFDPASRWLRDAVAEGFFGRVRMIRAQFSGFKRPRQDSGVTFADGVHFIDLCNYLTGRSPAKVTAVLHDFLGRGMDDASMISLEYDMPQGSAWATVEANYFDPGKRRELLLVGDKQTALCDFNVAQYKVKTLANRHVSTAAGHKAETGATVQHEFPPVEPLLLELRAFLASLTSREAPLADGWSGYHAVRVIEAAMESARDGRTISLTT